jgi:O-antigen ligase
LFAAVFLVFEWSDPGRAANPLGETLFLNFAAFVFSIGLLFTSIEMGIVRRQSIVRMALWSALIPLALVLQQYLGSQSGELPRLPFVDAITPVGADASRSGVAFQDSFRLAGPFSDPNFLAIFCAFTFGLAGLERPWISGRRKRLAVDGLRVACLLGVFASLSRTGAIIVIIFVAFDLISRPGRTARIGRAVLLIGTPLVIVVFSGLIPSSTLRTVQDRVRDPRSTATHLQTQKVAIELGQGHPFLGIGLGGLGPALFEPPDRSSAHGLPYTFFAEGGVVGLALVALALGYPLLIGLRRADGQARGALDLALIVTLFLYDYVFILDVAAVWWAIAMAKDDRLGAAQAGSDARQTSGGSSSIQMARPVPRVA